MNQPRTNCFLSTLLWLCISLCSASSASAADCPSIDKNKAIQSVMAQHAGSKILKVIEQRDKKGCQVLLIRILINGTVKAVKYTG